MIPPSPPIPPEPGVPLPCNLYPDCGFDCTWPDCVQEEEKVRAAFRRASYAATAAASPYDVEAGWPRLLAHMNSDTWHTLTEAERDAHIRLLHSLTPPRQRLANEVAPLVALLAEALLPVLIELYYLPHALARNWRIYRAKRAHHG